MSHDTLAKPITPVKDDQPSEMTVSELLSLGKPTNCVIRLDYNALGRDGQPSTAWFHENRNWFEPYRSGAKVFTVEQGEEFLKVLDTEAKRIPEMKQAQYKLSLEYIK